MIVYDLKCAQGHGFEGWFGSSADFADQQARSLVRCPYCDSVNVEKAVQAANVGAKGNQKPDVAVSSGPETLIRQMAELQQKMLAGSTWVGSDFATRARAMHYGEEDKASIHGSADAGTVSDMIEEGIVLAPLPIPIVPPEERN